MSRRGLARIWTDDSGLTAVEYALLLAWIGSIVAVSMLALANSVGNEIDETTTALDP